MGDGDATSVDGSGSSSWQPRDLAWRRETADRMPDLPRSVEAREMLRDEESLCLAPESPAPPEAARSGPSFVVCSPPHRLAALVGAPDAASLVEAVAQADELIVFPEDRAAVERCLGGDWRGEHVVVHRRPSSGVAGRPAHPVRTIAEHGEIAVDFAPGPSDGAERPSRRVHTGGDPVTERFRRLLADHEVPIVAAFDGERPVAFCYPSAVSEGLGAVSIDTVPSHHRRGFAASAALAMEALMEERGRRAVWAAVDSNLASLGLAARLGFEPVDEIWLFVRAED